MNTTITTTSCGMIAMLLAIGAAAGSTVTYMATKRHEDHEAAKNWKKFVERVEHEMDKKIVDYMIKTQ